MSSAQLQKFIAVISTDLVAWQKASKGATDVDSFVENVARYAHDKGYDFTADEVRTWMTQYEKESAEGELQDSELDGAAGGAASKISGPMHSFLMDLLRNR